ncbi:RING finger protein B [Hondaea fermentalgiana]|uniref:RING finger protein B n=1 Tax=Hondaea fermentalgiana TaxID=2315210 RepID=A0A2R5GK34_9STRA|nr:RING finger protein B [Hondaea fermentalgiana]|eukprot:GBG28993.1 RING finger protein B [Hondaea fermentalgiana]
MLPASMAMQKRVERRTVWREVVSTTSGPSYKNHTATLVGSKILVFGGYDGRGNHNNVFEFDCLKRSWRRADVVGEPPKGRNGHTATFAENKIFIVGGWLGSGPLAASDLHILETFGGMLRWREAPSRGKAPGPCNMHTTDYVAKKRSLFVFRGGDGKQYLNDLHLLNIDTLEWSKPDVTGQKPDARANHSSALVGEKLYIFGGWDGRQRLNDIHILDTETLVWSSPKIHGHAPSPRAGMTFTCMRDKIYLFGGSGPQALCYKDLQVFDPQTNTWLLVTEGRDDAKDMAVEIEKAYPNMHRSEQKGSSGATATSGASGYGASGYGASGYGASGYGASLSNWAKHDDSNDSLPGLSVMADDGESYSDGSSSRDYSPAAQERSHYRHHQQHYHQQQQHQQQQREQHMSVSPSSCKMRQSSENPNSVSLHADMYVVGKGPSERAGHTATLVGNKLIIFGGSCVDEYLQDMAMLEVDEAPVVLVEKNGGPLNRLQNKLRSFLDSPLFSDVTFIVEGRKLRASKLALALTSERFEKMFCPREDGTHFKEAEERDICINDVPYDVFRLMIEYLYTGELKLPFSNAQVLGTAQDGQLLDRSHPNGLAKMYVDGAMHSSIMTEAGEEPDVSRDLDKMRFLQNMLVCADRFMLDHLKQLCERELASFLSVSTVNELEYTALETNAAQLHLVCKHFQRQIEPSFSWMADLGEGCSSPLAPETNLM